jgi:branched-chain amino acid transport system substrate-binding protein
MKRIIYCLPVTLSLLFLSACSILPQTAVTIPGKPAVTVGALLCLSGDASGYGISQKKGIELAVSEINAGNYLGGGRELKMVIADGGSGADTAAAAMTSLIKESHVVGVIGPTLSAQAFKADPIAQEKGIPVIGVSNTVPGITEMGDFVFRCSLPESVVIGGTIRAAASQLRAVKVAYLWGNDDDYTRAGYKAFCSAVETNGLQVKADETFKRGDSDFKQQLQKIQATNPDAILVSALASEAALIIQQARSLGYKGIIIGGNGFNSPVVISKAGSSAEGVMAGTAWNAAGTNPRNLSFISAFQKAYGARPDQFATQAYTGAWLLARAIRIAGNSDPGTIRDSLADITNFTTPLGSFSFDGSREPVHPSVVQIVKNGKFTAFNP